MTKSFELRKNWSPMCCNCDKFEDDPETGNMYGICKVAKSHGKVGQEVVKHAFQICNEVI